MRILTYRDSDYSTEVARFSRRSAPPEGVDIVVAEIVAAVKERGDVAVLEYIEKFDGATFENAAQLRVSEEEFAGAVVSEEVAKAVAESLANVREFAEKSMRRDWSGTNAQGAEVGELYHPFERVGIYVPGGTAPLVSSANMTVAIAAAVGVPEIVVSTPCNAQGEVNPVLLYALREAGATEVYKVGGAQAIAAMAVGTGTIAPVSKIYGPGNSYVVEAKRQSFGLVAVDLLPGPSEVIVLSDSSGEPEWIASDLLAQAEHGGDSLAGFVTDSEDLLEKVQAAVERQAKSLSRQGPINEVLEKGCFLVLVPNLEEGLAIVNAFAPEHLSLIAENEEELIPQVRTAGAIFLGNYSPVAAGDFLAGPSHELPTGGAGKSFSGLTVDQFQRRTSVVKLDRAALKRSQRAIEIFAEVEGLDAHGRSATMRCSD
jgi:histidinol dehydrogenase